jgi:branched-chain amino acid transport system permease protein
VTSLEQRAEAAGAPARTARLVLIDLLPIVVAAGLLALVPLRYGDSPSMMGVVTDGLVFAAYTVAFNIIFGSTGQLFLCVGALAGLGGFGSAILADDVGLPLLLSITVGAAMAAVAGACLSWVAVRRDLGTIFVGVVTLAASLSFENLLLGLRTLTGGETGIFVEAGSDTILHERVPPYFVFLGLLVVYLVIFRVIQRSRLGWAFRALRDDQLAAELSGIDVARARVIAGGLGAGMLGLAGALYAHSGRGFIGPSTFAFGEVDVRVIVMLSIGGIGTLLGPVVGAAVLTWLDEWLIEYAELRLIIYGAVLIVLFIGFRRGVVRMVVDAANRIRRVDRPRPAATVDPITAPAETTAAPVKKTRRGARGARSA